MPESPRWLLSKNRKEEALSVLRDVATLNGKDAWNLFPLDTVLIDEEAEDSEFQVLFSPKWRKLTLCLWVIWMGFAFGYYGAILAVTRIFETQADDENALDFDYSSLIVNSTSEIFGLLIVAYSIDRIGRVASQVWSYIIGGIALFFMCILAEQTGQKQHYLLFTLSYIARASEMVSSCVTWVSTAEVLDTEIRSTGKFIYVCIIPVLE